jgi:hypothetical protein
VRESPGLLRAEKPLEALVPQDDRAVGRHARRSKRSVGNGNGDRRWLRPFAHGERIRLRIAEAHERGRRSCARCLAPPYPAAQFSIKMNVEELQPARSIALTLRFA